MNRMLAITISAGATTRAVAGIAWPPNRAFTIPPPTAVSTRKKVPRTSANRRRPSYSSSQKSNCAAMEFGQPSEVSPGRPGSGRALAALLLNCSRPPEIRPCENRGAQPMPARPAKIITCRRARGRSIVAG